MAPLQAEDILDNDAYLQQRGAIRNRVMEVKSRRRVHMGEHLTFLFENEETLRYQVQEMLRAEGRCDAKDISHEVSTYNELLGKSGELGATLLIEITDPEERDQRLRQWLNLPSHLFVMLDDGREARASFDPRQVGEDRLSSVQYLKFDCGGVQPVGLGCDLPGMELRCDLTPVQRRALADDMVS